MKKISVTTWLILAGIFLYTASLWQRPLFISEFACSSGAIDALCSGKTFPASEIPFVFVYKVLGMTPFSMRILQALLTLLSAGAILLGGRLSSRNNTALGGALIFLLTPAVFLCGTTALPYICSAAPVIIGFFLLFLMSESKSWKQALFCGTGAALFTISGLTFRGNGAHLLLLLGAWSIYCATVFWADDPCGKEKKRIPLFWTFLPFLPVLFFLNTPLFQTAFQLPQLRDLKTLAAFGAAGSFPWIIFLPAVLRNFSARVKFLFHENFTRAALVLAAASLAGGIFTPVTSGFFIVFLSGTAILLAAGLEAERAENGFRSINIVLYILAALFLLAAAALCSWALLGLHTKLIPPACKIFSAKDAWALSALVPAVAAVWCITGAGEKISKERKFLAFCAGIAFVLLAFHGLVPLKAVEYNAPVNFLQKVVMVRTGLKGLFYGDEKMFAPLQSVFRTSAVRRFSAGHSVSEIKKAVSAGERVCVVTTSRALSSKLPFPKTTLRSGSFSAVFYNIDFPEMRVRKP